MFKFKFWSNNSFILGSIILTVFFCVFVMGCAMVAASKKPEMSNQSKDTTTSATKADTSPMDTQQISPNEGAVVKDSPSSVDMDENAPLSKQKEEFTTSTKTSMAEEKKSEKPEKLLKTDKTNDTEDALSTNTTESVVQETVKAPPKEEVKYLSADDSNSCASPVIVRKLINSGKYVQPDLVRTYEFLNYATFSYPPPVDKAIAIIPAMRKLEEVKEGVSKYSLQIAVRSQNKRRADLPPLNITFLVDISGSMVGEPIALAKQFVGEFVSVMRPKDILSVVICNREAKVLLDSYQVNPQLLDKLNTDVFPYFVTNDITNLEAGITAAYNLAEKNYLATFLNRVILISDGAANAGQLARDLIGKHAEDSNQQGIYLAGLGVGEGFNDDLMNNFTDKGRGAYLFIDSKEEVARILKEDNLLANFDLAVKDVRLKMVIPPYWKMEEFHGEQVSSQASEVIPQYLSPNDQMIYHLVISAQPQANSPSLSIAEEQSFEFEVEYRPIGGSIKKESLKIKVTDMLKSRNQITKGDAVVEYAEFLKKVKYPLDTNENRTQNLTEFAKSFETITKLNAGLPDPEVDEVLALLKKYERTLKFGEQFLGREDKDKHTPDAVLGISPNDVAGVKITGKVPELAIKPLSRLLRSVRLVPQEGYKFLALSSGPVGNQNPSGSGGLAADTYPDPQPEYIGYKKTSGSRQQVFDLHQITLTLKAPRSAKSFSFDFNFFSAEYPAYVNKNYNDTFYAILEAASTNKGKQTNISFDPNHNSMEVDNNYFENPFHPIPNTGTGFDAHGSTGWLRTSWPIQGGEVFTLTFSIHDEGDGVYDSLVLLDNFLWHPYEAVGTTDPLN